MTPSTKTLILITYRPLADIQLDPKNPRAHSHAQVRQIARLNLSYYTCLYL